MNKKKQGAEAAGCLSCECGETCTIKRCASEKEIYHASCPGCRSRRFISPALLAAMERQKIIFDH